MNKGQRTAKELQNQGYNIKAASQWLLLYVIFKNPGINTKQIIKELEKLLKHINKKTRVFFIDWGGGLEANYSLEDTLLNNEEVGNILVERSPQKRGDNIISFYISNNGAKLLLSGIIGEQWPNIKEFIKPVLDFEYL